MLKLKKLIGIVSLCILSGCATQVPDIISVGDCERGIVVETNIIEVKKIWNKAELTDVLISGGCYQDRFIKKR